MNFRKLSLVAGLSVALVIGGGSAAFADSYYVQDTVSGAEMEATPVVEYVPGATTVVGGVALDGHVHVLPFNLDDVSNIRVFWQQGQRYLTEGTEFTVHSGSVAIRLTPAFLAQHTGVHSFVVSMGHSTLGNVVAPIRVALPAATNQGTAADGVRPVHPATGPAALVYGVGGLLLAGGGVSLVAASKRRKAELV